MAEIDEAAFGVLLSDPTIEPSVALAASLIDDPKPRAPRRQSTAVQWGMLIGVIIVLVAMLFRA
jgi:hypothetical protein